MIFCECGDCFAINMLPTLFVILTFAFTPHGAHVLGVFPAPSYSHYALGSRLMKELVAKGHDVTVISPYSQKPPLKNYRDIELTGLAETFEEERQNPFEESELNFIQTEIYLNDFLINLTKEVFKSDAVVQLIKSDEKFDLVVVEEFMSYALKQFCYHFKAPCIMFSSIGLSRMISSQVGNPISPAYIPDFSLSYTSNMRFFERLHNSFVYLFGELYKHIYVFPEHDRMMQKNFPAAPRMSKLYYNVSLAFVNSHVSTHQAVPYVPNLVDIGGLHIQPPKQLPEDLRDYLDNAREGVIFFSMGSNIKGVEWPPEKREAILKTFAKLKQRVLWKWEGEVLPGKPDNVKTGKWLPQSDILAHPNVKLFVTHGGLLSTIEAVYHGVPIIGIPVYGDQKMNLANAVNTGIGLGISYSDLTEETFCSTIKEVLRNPKYRENAKKRSKIMHDQPMKPLDKAVFWVEYVIRHQGAPHLRSAALNLSWYQYLLLDVILFVVVSVITTVTILYCGIKRFILSKRHLPRTSKEKKAK